MLEKRKVTLNGAEFILGDRYRDALQDVSGRATAGVSYLTGCDQLELSSKDGNGLPFRHWVDVTRVESVKVEARRGGPAPTIGHRHP